MNCPYCNNLLKEGYIQSSNVMLDTAAAKIFF